MNATAYSIAIKGDLTIYTVREWRDTLARTLHKHTLLEVDLAGVQDCDSAGIQLLVLLKFEADAEEREVVFRNISAPVLDLIMMFRLHGMLGLSGTVAGLA